LTGNTEWAESMTKNEWVAEFAVTVRELRSELGHKFAYAVATNWYPPALD
jgi:hypothetical protein